MADLQDKICSWKDLVPRMLAQAAREGNAPGCQVRDKEARGLAHMQDRV